MLPDREGCQVAKRKDSFPPNDGQYRHIFDKRFVTVETELVKLATASPGFTICFGEAYDHFHADKSLILHEEKLAEEGLF